MGSQRQSRLQELQAIARGFAQSDGPTSSFMMIEGLWEALKSYPDHDPLPDRTKWVMLLEKAGHLYGSMVQADVSDRYGGDVGYYTPFIQKAFEGLRELGHELDRSTGARIAEAN